MENRWNIQEAPSCLKVDQQSSSPWPLSVGQPRLLVWPSFFFLFFSCVYIHICHSSCSFSFARQNLLHSFHAFFFVTFAVPFHPRPTVSSCVCLPLFFPPSIPNPPLHSRVHLTKEEFITALSSLFPHDLMFRAAPVRGKIKMTN